MWPFTSCLNVVLIGNRSNLQSLPQFLIGPLPEVLEVPVGSYMLGRADPHAIGSDSGKLHLVDGVAVPLIYDGEALMQDLSTLLLSAVGVPMIGNQCQAEVFGESSSEIVLADMIAEEIDAGKMGLAVLETSHDEVVVVGVLVVTLLVGQLSQVVGVVRHRMRHVVIEKEALVLQLPQTTGRLLEVSILPSGCYQHIIGNLLIPVDAGVL